MGELLDELIQEIKHNTLDQQVLEICHLIAEQEQDSIMNPEYAPIGPNIFLVLECPGRIKNELGYLTLERELQGEYVIGFWAITPTLKNDKLKRYKAYSVNEVNSKRIIRKYAEKLKYYRGEL